MRGHFTERRQHGDVDCACVIKEDSYDLLDELRLVSGERRGVIEGSELGSLAIRYGYKLCGGVGRLGAAGDIEELEGCVNVSWHAD